MAELFGNRFAPITFTIGFLERPFTEVADAFCSWRREIKGAASVLPIEMSLPEAFSLLEPLTTPPRRSLLWATDSSWTAYFDNGIRGPDPVGPTSHLALRLGCRGAVTSCIPHTLADEKGSRPGTYGATQFQLFTPVAREFLNYERTISVAFDSGRWRFDTSGRAQPFEEVEAYAARRVLDRFTPEMLERYCQALGIRMFEDDFYSGPGVMIGYDKIDHGKPENGSA